MNVNIKQRLTGKGAYITLVLLLVSILVFTVIAIIATVNSQEEPTVPPVAEGEQAEGEETPAPAPEVPSEGESTPVPEDKPSDAVPEAEVYVVPCEGAVQKEFANDTLVFSQTMNDHRVHLGIDISGNVGDPVKAFGKGRIEKIYTDTFMGKTVVIDHGNGLKSMYMNLSDSVPEGVSVGTEVERGTVIGAIGESAMIECADHPHLHFEIVLDGRRVDPRNYVTLPSSAEGDTSYEG